MKTLLSIMLLLNSSYALAHNNENHIEKYRKNKTVIQLSVLKYNSLKGKSLKLEALHKQIKLLNQNLFILRKLMAKEYPHVKEAMSKYKVDYMKELESSSEQLDSIVDKLQDVNGNE